MILVASTPAVQLIVNGGNVISQQHLVTLGPVTLDGGTMTADTGFGFAGTNYHGAFDLNGDVTVTGSAPSTLASINDAGLATFNLGYAAGSTTFDVATGASLLISAAVADRWSSPDVPTDLIKTGGGTLTLSNTASNFQGNIALDAGTTIVSGGLLGANPTNSPLGNPQVSGRTITVDSAATLLFTQHDPLGNVASTPAVQLIVDGGNVISQQHLVTLGPVTLNGGTLTADTGFAFAGTNFHGAFDLNGDVTVTGGATSTLASVNDAGLATFNLTLILRGRES